MSFERHQSEVRISYNQYICIVLSLCSAKLRRSQFSFYLKMCSVFFLLSFYLYLLLSFLFIAAFTLGIFSPVNHSKCHCMRVLQRTHSFNLIRTFQPWFLYPYFSGFHHYGKCFQTMGGKKRKFVKCLALKVRRVYQHEKGLQTMLLI